MKRKMFKIFRFTLITVILCMVLLAVFFGCERNPTKLVFDYYDLSGYIFESATDPPKKLANALVTIGKYSVTTNDSGLYVIKAVVAGTYNIQAELTGYTAKSYGININSNRVFNI